MKKSVRLALDSLLEEKNVTRYFLAKQTKIPYPTIDKYFKNKVVRYDSDIILRICLALDCTPGDLIRLVEAEEESENEA